MTQPNTILLYLIQTHTIHVHVPLAYLFRDLFLSLLYSSLKNHFLNRLHSEESALSSVASVPPSVISVLLLAVALAPIDLPTTLLAPSSQLQMCGIQPRPLMYTWRLLSSVLNAN